MVTTSEHAASMGGSQIWLEEGEKLSDKAMMKKIRQIDKDRKRYHGIISDIPWGDRHGYHLTVNTSGRDAKSLVPLVAEYYRHWLAEQE